MKLSELKSYQAKAEAGTVDLNDLMAVLVAMYESTSVKMANIDATLTKMLEALATTAKSVELVQRQTLSPVYLRYVDEDGNDTQYPEWEDTVPITNGKADDAPLPEIVEE